MKTVNNKSDDYLRLYKSIKQSLNLPLKINLYFNYMEAALQAEDKHKNIQNLHGFSQLFYPTFCQLAKQQKAHYLFYNIQFIKAQYDKIQAVSDSKINSTQNGNSIKATGQISQSKLGLTYWSKVQISFCFQTRKIKLITKNRNYQIDLRLYLVRKSKKYQNTLVLEAISEIVSVLDKKISLFFRQTIFQQIYNQIFKCIVYFRNQQLFKIALEEYSYQKNLNLTQMSYIGSHARSLNFLSSKNINQFLNFKDEVLKRLLKSDFNFQTIYSIKDTKIQLNTKKAKGNYSLYKLEANFNESVTVLKQKFLQKYKNQNFKYLIQSQQLQKCSNKYSALYQKFLFNNSIGCFKTIEQIVIQQVNLKQIVCQNEELIFQKGIKAAKIKDFIDYLIIKVKGLGTQNKSKLIIIGSFNQEFQQISNSTQKNNKECHVQSKTYKNEAQQTILMFLLQFSQMIFKKQNQLQNMQQALRKVRSQNLCEFQNCSKINNQFFTVQGKFNNQGKQQFVLNVQEDLCENDFQSKNNLKNYSEKNLKAIQNNYNSEIIEPALTNHNIYLKHIYQLEPILLSFNQNSQKIIQQKHFLFSQWYRKSNGGFVCKDMTAINQQKKVANFLLKNIGKRIFQQRGLFNLSLPVTIFKPQSHLHSVAKNLNFAPIFLEKATKMESLQRMKMVLLFSISITISSISVSKPFNPILGETLQMWIDGCPVYLEQISHHPPIVAYYMIGRGYKIYGSIGPKASFGLNNITGYSQEPNFIQFDDGTTIELNFGKMVINGIIFGERTFNFADKMYAIDPKNKIFSQLKFGQERISIFSTNVQPQDFFHGKIYKTKPQFIEQFYKNSNVTYPLKENISEELSKFEGIWNGKIFFDDKQYINFGEANGCKVQDQKYPLPSNSSYRADIKQLKQGNINNSQYEKENLENIQRRDRDLRKNHTKTN